ncbi:TPA: hypothetical protein MEB24_002580 [Klebsiella aerogenes]|uniref:hypothetical protein n=1 Tax=Klebsiella aerogenes TaxID=548 RepID=UPI0002AB1E0A|nr:hypothetical protein [Klebsiella aerogenes]CCG28878.1 hypothetical protein [Klebsiella aerogenes EA1509E]AMH08757.1 hypothetical protein AL511_06200 [Klebsiella aerogenes]AML34008.1 Hypothetical protein EAG7_00258 [Klebsiella aerogenes]AMQ58667.1 hypothetical protein AL497_02515 [Klebsiella aerogenes]ATM92484.1 hypothetical protein CRN78_18880 [Klebsiella aerogenes]
MNNLPPLEYCSIARAQKLLQCELEDLLHWHDIGAISLCLKLKKNRGTLNSALTRNQGVGDSSYGYGGFDDITKANKPWSQHSKINNIITLNENVSVIDADHDSAIAKIKLNVSVSGLWHTHSRNLMDVLENPDNIQQEDTLSIISPAKNVIYCNFIPDNDDKPTIELNKLYITSKEIEKIYEHTISSRPLEYSEAAMNSYNEKTINEPSTPPQNKLLLEFINYIIQSNPAFNRDLLNATESSKQLAFKSIMEKLKKEGIVTNENHSMASLSELILNS